MSEFRCDDVVLPLLAIGGRASQICLMMLFPAAALDDADIYAPDGPYAFARLALSLLISTLVGAGMWAVIVVLPQAQLEFGVDRAAASLPYTADDVHARLRDDRVGADDGSRRHRRSHGYQRREPGHWLCSGRLRAQPHGVFSGPRADRRRRGDRLRADDGGYFALVRQAARARGGRCGVRQLPRGHDLAVADEPDDAAHRLAGDLCRHRPHHRCDGLAVGSADAPAAIGRGHRRSGGGDPGGARRCWNIAATVAGSVGSGRLFLLCGDVDAAGPSRRLLRRPRLRRRARRRNAFAHDVARHRIAHRLRHCRRRDWRRADAHDRLLHARRGAHALSLFQRTDVALRRLGNISACFRAGSCRCTRSSAASCCRRARPAP